MAEGDLLELPVEADGEYVLRAGPKGVRRIAFGLPKGESGSGLFCGTPDRLRLVEQWGHVAWESMAYAFFGCENMNLAGGIDAPDLRKTQSMRAMFRGCEKLNAPVEHWNVSRVTDMSYLFRDGKSFNQPLGGWDVSRVASMRAMFMTCYRFNQPIGGWDVSNVTDMSSMFHSCGDFNQPIGGWDVSRVTDMFKMFGRCEKFNQPLDGWDVSNVVCMRGIFGEFCYRFNQPLGGWTLSALKCADSRYGDLDFNGANLGLANYSEMLVAWAAKRDQLQEGVRIAARECHYNAEAKVARQLLVDEKGWTFLGDKEAPAGKPLKVYIQNAPARLPVGATHTFTAVVEPADAPQEVVWKLSADYPGISLSGNVLTVREPQSGIYVSARSVADPECLRAVQIDAYTPIPLRGIAVGTSDLRMAVGTRRPLTVRYDPERATNREVSWSSSDASVATVDAQGAVKGLKAGTATITVTSADGAHMATCRIEVHAAVHLIGIALDPSAVSLGVGEVGALTVHCAPSDATNRRVTWSSSNELVAQVDAQGVVKGLKAGTATITATSTDGGHKAICVVTVVATDMPSGVESAQLSGVTVSPNPFGDVLLVGSAECVVRYALVNALGVVIRCGVHDGSPIMRVDMPTLPCGTYWLRLEATDGERVLGVVKE